VSAPDPLTAADPFAGRLPICHGTVTLAACDPGPIWQIAPWPGAEQAASEACAAAHGAHLPGPGMTADTGGARLLWAGHRCWLLLGAAPDTSLAPHAGLIALTDGWVGLTLTGAGWDAAMARLTPLDVRPSAFPPGATARADLAHMQAQITRAPDGVEMLLMRSFAVWAIDRIAEAMRSVAAQAGPTAP
jgi:heterotetrameric sarcosine oxidase gamma subunit